MKSFVGAEIMGHLINRFHLPNVKDCSLCGGGGKLYFSGIFEILFDELTYN